MAYKSIQYNNLTWYLFTSIEDADMNFLRDNFKYHKLSLKDVANPQEYPKIDVFEKYVFGVFLFPEFKKDVRKIVSHEVDVFLGKDYIITILNSDFKSLKSLFFTVASSFGLKKEFFAYDSTHLLYHVLNSSYTRTCEPILVYLTKFISELEEMVYNGGRLKDNARDIGVARRNVLNYEKIIFPQVNTISTLTKLSNDPLSKLHNEFISTEASNYFGDIGDYIERVKVILSNQYENIKSLSITNESLISSQTNSVIKTLTVLSVSLLPLTLFSSLYGMNIELPYTQYPHMVWTFFGILFVIVTSIAIYFMKKK